MSDLPDLMKAIRSGKLADVVAVLDSGTPIELNDGDNPGLPLAVACFMGHTEIVRELVLRGAKLNFADNRDPASPLSMAVRGKRKEVVKILVELGSDVPPGIDTGLSDQELRLARWKAECYGATAAAAGLPPGALPDIEEIQVTSCYGTDTGVLDADIRRAVQEMSKK